MLAIPTLIKHADGSYTWSEDALWRLPPELIDHKRMEDYKKISKPGWSNQEYGYKNFSFFVENGDLYTLPALQILDDRPRKRFPGYDQKFSKEQIERYSHQLSELFSDHHEKVVEELNLLVHDLRRLSTAIYHSSQEALNLVSPFEHVHQNLREARIRIENVIGAQSMLKIRTDVLDYEGNPDVFDEGKDVPIYRRVDKVIKSFTAFAEKKGIRLHKEGTSFRVAKGPDVFEVVAYVILENAIKYSPHNNDITVKFSEISGYLQIDIVSTGPKIEPSEREDIFLKGVRGNRARAGGTPGSGVGLFLAKKIVERFRGQISAICTGSYIIMGQEMADVTFRITIPLKDG